MKAERMAQRLRAFVGLPVCVPEKPFRAIVCKHFTSGLATIQKSNICLKILSLFFVFSKFFD
jgi:hypothetical protein